MKEILILTLQLFAILNPLSIIPEFLVLTSKCEEKARNRIVNKAALIVFAIMFFFTISGKAFLDIMDISVDAFMFGGGILLLVIAMDMLGGLSRTKRVEEEEIAVVPIATPLLVGPGTMTTLIILSTSKSLLLILPSVAITVFLSWLILRTSNLIQRALGNNGIKALARIMAIILAAVAASFIHSALVAWGIAS